MSDTEPEPIEDLLGDVTNVTEPTIEYEEWSPGSGFGDEDNLPPPGDGQCNVCGAPTFRPPGLTKAGRRKRVPKFCDIHAPSNQNGSDYLGPTGILTPELKRVQEELADEMRLAGMMAGPFLPVTGYYTMENADPFTIAFVKLCAKNPKALKFAYKFAQTAPLYELCKMMAGLARCVVVDTKHVDPHTPVDAWLGVQRTYDAVYSNVSPTSTSTVSNNGFGPPPRYAPAA